MQHSPHYTDITLNLLRFKLQISHLHSSLSSQSSTLLPDTTNVLIPYCNYLIKGRRVTFS